MGQNAVARRRVGGGWQVPLGLWLMLGICSTSVLESYMKHYLYLFLRMAVRQCSGGRDLGLGLYEWTTSEDCLVLGGWVESRMH